MMRSLRIRLVAATFAASILILLTAASFIYGLIRASLLAEFDMTLLAKARAIAAVAEQDEGRFELDLGAAQMPEFDPGKRCEYFQIWDEHGRPLSQSTSLLGDSLNNPSGGEVPSFRYTTLPDGRPGRQLTLLSSIPTDHGIEGEAEELPQAVVLIAAARDTLDLNHTLGQLALLLGSVTVGAGLLTVVVLSAVVRFALKPVGVLAAQIAKVDATNVSHRGEFDCSIEELDPIVDRLNELLDRLNTAFAREKAFTADVAHELRTPLAGLSAALEVCASRPRDESAYREVVLKCLGTSRAMQTMVENLLMLVRADAGQLTLQNESFDLRRFVKECWCSFQTHVAGRKLTVDWPGNATPMDVATDREKLRLVLCNLFDNAARHSTHGGRVTIIVDQGAGEAVVEIRNTGCSLVPEEAEKVFQRFWKKDTVRTEGAEHCGLGLPLCRRIVEALGGSIDACVENSSFAVKIRLPRVHTQVTRSRSG
jgi:two-component system heavy metal sensor histidine kinase CusS